MNETADLLRVLNSITLLNERVRQLAEATQRIANEQRVLRDRIVKLELKAASEQGTAKD